MSEDKRERIRTPDVVKMTVNIPRERHEAFLRVYHEFLGAEGAHDQAIRQRAEDRNQGIASLRELVKVAQRDSGQCRYIARFLAACYNGPRFPFDLTDLRAIDDHLFEHCMAVLRMEHHLEKEVHQYFVDGSALWESIIREWDLDGHTLKEAIRNLSEWLENSGNDAQRRLGDALRALDIDRLQADAAAKR
jgi:hypothetical protein